MKYRTLGKHGPKISAIGYGAMSITGFFGPTDTATSMDCLSAVADGGIDFIDTAELYGGGSSETLVGQFMKDTKTKFKIATKAGIRPECDPIFDNSKPYITQALEGSLKRLGVEYVDLYYIHRREQDRPIEEVVETLKGFIDQGKIGGYGLSEVSPTTLRRAPCCSSMHSRTE